MTSLLQHRGGLSRKGVHLELYHTTPNMKDVAGLGPIYADMPTSGIPVEMVPCSVCGGEHERLHVVIRKPVGMLGCWVVFRWNGEKHAPDLSVPIATFKLPRDAKPMTDEENSIAWHR